MTYEDNVKRWKEAYTHLLDACENYPEFYDKYGFDDIRKMQASAKSHLELIDWYEKYGLKLSHDYQPYSYNYFKINDYLKFNRFNDGAKDKAEGSGKFISWSDDDKQPKNEWLFEISFSTGAYIFGQDYDGQKELFQKFFKELESYKPDYSDSHNHSLYWKLENAKSIFDNFNKILEKYRKLNSEDLKNREIKQLEKKLHSLKELL
jgi:hypothetical protein